MRVYRDAGCAGGSCLSDDCAVGRASLTNEQVGASIVYTPEQGITLDTLRDDVRFLKTRYSLDVKGKSEGRVVLR